MEAVIYQFYTELEQGRILGRKCRRCGTIAFPPRGLCVTCGSADADWVEMSGRGKLLYASAGQNLLLGGQYIQATVELDEGPLVAGILLDESLDSAKPERILELCGRGIDVEMKVSRNPCGGVIVAFKRKTG